MGRLFVIRNWENHFEVSQTRKVEIARWVPVPVRHDGLRFRRLMAMSDGLEIFGAWVLILEVAAKCKSRGTLAADNGDPLTAADLAAMTGATEKKMTHALEVLCSPAVAWIESIDSTPLESKSSRVESESNRVPLQDSTGEERREDRTGEDKTGEERRLFSSEPQAASEQPVLIFPTVGESPNWKLSTDHVANLQEAFPDLDVLSQCRKARQWCVDNRRNRKTPRGMPKFLFGWMSRAQNARGGHASQSQVVDAAREYLENSYGKP